MKTASAPSTAGASSVVNDSRPAAILAATSVVEPGLVDRHLAALHRAIFAAILVDAGHRHAEFREAGARYQTHIPRPDHCDAHRIDFPRTIGCRAAPAPLAVLAREFPPPSFINSAQLAQIVPYFGRLASHIDRRSENSRTVRCLNLFRGNDPGFSGHHSGISSISPLRLSPRGASCCSPATAEAPAICDWRIRRASGASGLGRVRALRRGSGCRTNGAHFTHLFLGQTLSR